MVKFNRAVMALNITVWQINVIDPKTLTNDSGKMVLRVL